MYIASLTLSGDNFIRKLKLALKSAQFYQAYGCVYYLPENYVSKIL